MFRREQRVHGCLSSRSHLTLERLHDAHARLTARWSPSHDSCSRTQRVHGRVSLHAVLARWQFLHACSLGFFSSSTSWHMPSSGSAGAAVMDVLGGCMPYMAGRSGYANAD
eukprot:6368805-Prymnesium_polylepis.1